MPATAEAQSVDAAIDLSAAERVGAGRDLAVDAGSLDFITRATAKGRLPNFGRILDGGGRDAAGDTPSDLGRSRVGGRGDREAAAEKWCAVGGKLSVTARWRADPAAAGLLLIARCWCGSGF